MYSSTGSHAPTALTTFSRLPSARRVYFDQQSAMALSTSTGTDFT